MRSLPTGTVVSRAEALTLGWTDSALTRAVRAGRLSRPRRGYFVQGSADERHRAQAAASACTGGAVSHRSAAIMHGVPVVGRHPALPELTRSPRSTGDFRDAHLYRATLRAGDVVEIDGVAVTSLPRTLIDLARDFPLRTSVAALDYALHEELVDVDTLQAVCLECGNWPGIRRARRALGLADARSESPLESISRLAIRRMPFPAPVPQQRIGDRMGRFVARTDLGWADLGVVGEADGLLKYRQTADARDEDSPVLVEEKKRQESLEQLGLVVVRWGWTDVTRQPQQLQARIAGAFARAEALKGSGLPTLWSVLAS